MMQRGHFKVEKVDKVVRQSMEPQYNNQTKVLKVEKQSKIKTFSRKTALS